MSDSRSRSPSRDSPPSRRRGRSPDDATLARRWRDDRPSKRKRDRSPSRSRSQPRPPRRERDHDRPRKRRSRSTDRHLTRTRRSRSRGSPPYRDDRRRERLRDTDTDPDRDRDKDKEKESDDHGRRHRSSRRRHEHDHRRRSRSKSHSPPSTTPARRTERFERTQGPLPSQKDAFQGTSTGDEASKQKADFKPSGLLAAAANSVNTKGGAVVLKYHEPSNARKPPASQAWRMYVFKQGDIVETIDLHEQSCWLFGRDESVVDHLLQHPSCSKQHAVVQFRFVDKTNEFGDHVGTVKPYLIDLESGNGTKLNDDSVPNGRYVELRDADVVTFGFSEREYVVQLPPSRSNRSG